MKITTSTIGFLVLSLIFHTSLQSQSHEHFEKIVHNEYILNKGQWQSNVHFMANVNGGRVWLEDDGFTWAVLNMEELEAMHEENHSGAKPYSSNKIIHGHAFRQIFVGANEAKLSGSEIQKHYRNYFLGNDPSKWASNVPVYHNVNYSEIYPGIGIKVYGENGNFKYDFIVDAGKNPSQIKFRYEGVPSVNIRDKKLVISTSIGEIAEQEPFAYQIKNGKKQKVACNYAMDANGNVSFHFPEGYDKKLKLIIDPVVIASTYSGSTETVYGHTATYDASGNIYSAGASFSGPGYPTTTGAFQTTPNGSREFALTKYNPDGSQQIFATLCGGTSDDYPHSMVVNGNEELFILGSSSSTDFPTVSGSYDVNLNGSYDIVVVKFNLNGTALLGSTYVGGSGSDGQNSNSFNYGDTYKGEIAADANGNVYVASVSSSANFPVTAGAIQATNGGAQDGVVFKLNGTLTNLEWSTYLGGNTSGNDACYSVVPMPGGDVYVCGAATSGFPTTSGVVNPNYLGGTHDGFIAHINNTGTALLASTFIGTAGRDQNFFIQIDKFGEVYVNGQTDATITVTPGTYSGPGNGSYIMRLDEDLTAIDLVSKYGNTAMTAFLVDECNNIYASGHGGLSTLTPSTYEVTPGAFNSTGGGFYLLVLNPNASSILFGTFYGNGGAHVDGGTSRFDPNGVVYENVCTSAGSPTTSWAYATSSSAGWDNYVFKIDFEATGVVANAFVEDFFSCTPPPFDVDFTGSGASIPDHYWDFGDGNTSILPDPTHTYADTGTYTVMYIAIDSSSCNIADTAYATFTIQQAEEFSAEWSYIPPAPCEDTLYVEMEFSGTGADSIIWNMGDGMVFNDVDSVEYFYTDPGTYTIMMIAYDNVCNNVDTLSQSVTLDETAGGGQIFVPNVFSPNGDAYNEEFKVAYLDQPGVDALPDLSEYHIQVYDRWGLLMFESGENITDWAWDGKNQKNKDCPQGTYYYIIRYKGFCEMNPLVEDHGYFTLLR